MGLLKKIKRTVRKIVPKEVSGIMRAAAPFVAPYSLPAAAALSIGGQLRSGQGRISPLETVLALAPSDAARGLTRKVPGGQALDQFLYGTGVTYGGPMGMTEIEATQGILGTGGKFGLEEFAGSKLLSPDKTLSKPRLAALAASGLSLATATKQLEEEAVEEGVSDSDIDALKAEASDFWSTLSSSDFAVTPTLAKGGRVGFQDGTDVSPTIRSEKMANYKALSEPLDYGKQLPPFLKRTPIKYEQSRDDFETMQKERFMYDYDKPKIPEKILNKIRDLLDKDDRQASAVLGDESDDIAYALFGKRYKDLNPAELDEFNMYLDNLEKKFIKKDFKNRTIAAKGGIMRQNLALGTRPTAQESGLGGLPIEADMRYSGGFMPYGAKEKADDVPARLSKNEFVFTADAVRAAGGGSVQKGAQRMYNTMKQLEAMGRS